VTHELAKNCGLNVPEARLEKFSKYGSTFLTMRFDRDGKRRIHYASSMTLLGKSDGASAQDGTSYLDIAGFIRAYGANPKNDLEELWCRIVFSMAVTNTDDHLRNHAFILSKKGWTLSPMFDVNPVPYGNELALNVDEQDNRISIELALRTAGKYGIDERKAEKLAKEINGVVSADWENLAKTLDMSRSQIENMRPAFKKYL
ncbi:MAG: HipA domain-containing protein, partial [Mogibacterium sp.]|nr:HipA domain-containing protein [Mogibacterium sp.]